MLLFKDGCFHALGVCFSIPDGFILETEPNNTLQYGLGAWTPDEKLYVEWEIDQGCNGTYNELSELFSSDIGMLPITGITPVSVNGLSGHRVSYRNRNCKFFEVRLAVGPNTEISVTISGTGHQEIDVEKNPQLQTVINGIRRSL